MNENSSSVTMDSVTLTPGLDLIGMAIPKKDKALPSPQTAIQDLQQRTSNYFGLAILQSLSCLPHKISLAPNKLCSGRR
jgi:hypothetical protein